MRTREELQASITEKTEERAKLYVSGQTLQEEAAEVAKELATVAGRITSLEGEILQDQKELATLDAAEQSKSLTKDHRLWIPAFLKSHPGLHHISDLCTLANKEDVVFKTDKGKDIPESRKMAAISEFIRGVLVTSKTEEKAYRGKTPGTYGWGEKPPEEEKKPKSKKHPFQIVTQQPLPLPIAPTDPVYDDMGRLVAHDSRYQQIVEGYIQMILSGTLKFQATRKHMTMTYLNDLVQQKLSPYHHADLMRETLDQEANPGGRLDGYLLKMDQKTPVNAEMTYVRKGTPGPAGWELHIPAVQPKPPPALRRMAVVSGSR